MENFPKKLVTFWYPGFKHTQLLVLRVISLGLGYKYAGTQAMAISEGRYVHTKLLSVLSRQLNDEDLKEPTTLLNKAMMTTYNGNRTTKTNRDLKIRI